MTQPPQSIDFSFDRHYFPPSIAVLADGRKRVALSAMTQCGNDVQGLDPDFAIELAEAITAVAIQAGGKPKSRLVVPQLTALPDLRKPKS